LKKCATQLAAVKGMTKKIMSFTSTGLKSAGDALKLKDILQSQAPAVTGLCSDLMTGIDGTIAGIGKIDKMEAAALQDERDKKCASFEAACDELSGAMSEAGGLVW